MSETLQPGPPLAADDLRVEMDGTSILGGVSIDVRNGELLGLIGPNGSGKTTLLRSLAGLLPSDGHVWLEGRELARLGPRAVAQLVARVPQSTAHDGGFSGEDVVLAGRTPYLGRLQWETARDRAIAHEAMAQTATVPFANRPVAELSGGERQRVFVARALAQQTRVLLLDEPTASLDLSHQVRVLELVRRLTRQGVSAIAAVHDLELAARYCDRLVLLYGGEVLAEGTPESVITAEHLARAYGVRAIVEHNPHVRGLRVTVLEAIDGSQHA